jgi:hypothetical protein
VKISEEEFKHNSRCLKINSDLRLVFPEEDSVRSVPADWYFSSWLMYPLAYSAFSASTRDYSASFS